MKASASRIDESFMLKAVTLAHRAKGHTFPNPAVGAIVVRAGRIVGTGCTAAYGGDHAEKAALHRAGKKAHGATLYVTLEPCCHHGRTPPCTDAIIAAGITRVVAAMKDPNPLVAGKGLDMLRRHGIRVTTGVLRHAACSLNEDFCWAITAGRPWVSLKLALTLDGRIADTGGDSKWITNKQARTMVHRIRSRHAAIAVGRSTLLKDNPALTVRHVEGVSPVRFVFSSTPRIPQRLQFVKTAKIVRSIVVCPGGAAQTKNRRKNGVEVWHTGTGTALGTAKTFLAMAHAEGLNSILIEGGSTTASLFLENKLVNRVYIFFGNRILGNGLAAFSFKNGLPMQKPLTLDKIEYQKLGDNFMVTGILAKPRSGRK